MTPGEQRDRGRGPAVRRRLITVPRTFLLLTALTVLAPLLVALAVLVDSIRRIRSGAPAMTLRLLAFGWVFLAAEAVGILWMGVTWIRCRFGTDRDCLMASTWPVQRWWARTLWRAVLRLFGLRVEARGLEAATPGPIIAMFRHVSIVDNLLPAVHLTDRLSLRLRWVLKQELITLPSLDIAGHRLPNHFVDRSGAETTAEVARIAALGTDLGTDEGVLIYPEGTRFTPAKRRRALDTMAGGDPALYALGIRMQHVLPPRLGGPLALLDSGSDVVIVAHAGLDGFSDIRQIWAGSIVGRTVTIEAWRFQASSIPVARQARAEWLYRRWLEVDRWIGARLAGETGS